MYARTHVSTHARLHVQPTRACTIYVKKKYFKINYEIINLAYVLFRVKHWMLHAIAEHGGIQLSNHIIYLRKGEKRAIYK